MDIKLIDDLVALRWGVPAPATWLSVPSPAWAQTDAYPNKPVTLVCGYRRGAAPN
jgi:hypothetical protein